MECLYLIGSRLYILDSFTTFLVSHVLDYSKINNGGNTTSSELQDNEKKIPAEIGLAYCNKFFFIERQLKDLSPDERMMKRQEKEVPVWDSFFKWIETAKANQLNVYQYLYMVLLYMPDYKNEPAGIEKLLPWSDFIKEHCTGLIDVENITPENHMPLPF